MHVERLDGQRLGGRLAGGLVVVARVGDLVVHAQLEPRLGLEELCVNGLCVRLVPVAAEERYCFGADVALGKGEVIVRERELVRLGYFVWGS